MAIVKIYDYIPQQVMAVKALVLLGGSGTTRQVVDMINSFNKQGNRKFNYTYFSMVLGDSRLISHKRDFHDLRRNIWSLHPGARRKVLRRIYNEYDGEDLSGYIDMPKLTQEEMDIYFTNLKTHLKKRKEELSSTEMISGCLFLNQKPMTREEMVEFLGTDKIPKFEYPFNFVHPSELRNYNAKVVDGKVIFFPSKKSIMSERFKKKYGDKIYVKSYGMG